MADYLLDTSICLALLQGESAVAATRVASFEIGGIVTSSVVFAEVMIGARQRDRLVEAKAFFDQVPVLPFDEAAGIIYSTLPFRRGSYDRLIAAQALSLEMILVTANVRDFADVPGLKIEDWTR